MSNSIVRHYFLILTVISTLACGTNPEADTGTPAASADVQAGVPGVASTAAPPPSEDGSSSGAPVMVQAPANETSGETPTANAPTPSAGPPRDEPQASIEPVDEPVGTAESPDPADESTALDGGSDPSGDVITDAAMDEAVKDDAGDGEGGDTASGASPGCGGAMVAPGDTNHSVDVGGTTRSFILHVPASYTGDAPVPFVIDFHPLGGSGSQEQQASGYQRIADEEGFPIAFPDGLDNAWNVGPCCTNSREVDDVGFALSIVETVAAETCIDLKRVYAVGFSMGGGMSHHLACNAADTFAAVAPAAFDLLIPEEQPCNPSRPISSITFRGSQDTTSPFNGGPGPSGRATFLGAYDGFAAWREKNGCGDVNTVDGDCTIYTECDEGVEVGLCVAQGGGHAYGDANLGWAFIQRFSLP